SRFADVDGDAAAYGCEARLVRKIVAKVKRKSTTECRLRKKMPDGTTLSGNGSRKHLDIAQIFHAAQSVPKLSELAANRKSNARLNGDGHIEQVNREAAALVLDPDAGILAELSFEMQACAAKRSLGGDWKARSVAAFPTV